MFSHSLASSTPQASDDPPARSPLQKRLRKELLILGISAVIGFLVMPGLIYLAGRATLGAYAGGKPLGAFYWAYFTNLGQWTGRTWFIVASPYATLTVLRVIFWRWKRTPRGTDDQTAAESTAARETANRDADARKQTQSDERATRKEPFIGS